MLGPEHPDTLSSASNLAVMLRRQQVVGGDDGDNNNSGVVSILEEAVRIDRETLEARSVAAVTKRQLEHAKQVYMQALGSSSVSRVHGPRRVARRDLNPIMNNLRPALSDADLQVESKALL